MILRTSSKSILQSDSKGLRSISTRKQSEGITSKTTSQIPVQLELNNLPGVTEENRGALQDRPELQGNGIGTNVPNWKNCKYGPKQKTDTTEVLPFKHGKTMAEDILVRAVNRAAFNNPKCVYGLMDSGLADDEFAKTVCAELHKMGYWIEELPF